MARPTMLTRVRHERIINLLRDGVPFATACRAVGVSASAGYEWLYRGWSTHPDRPPTAVYVAFARDVDAVFPGGFAERHGDEDEFAAVTERPNQSSEGTATPERPARSRTSRHTSRLRSLRTGAKQVRPQGFRSFRSRERGLRKWRSR
jgi:hypothetical protein